MANWVATICDTLKAAETAIEAISDEKEIVVAILKEGAFQKVLISERNTTRTISWAFTTDGSGDATTETSATVHGRINRVITNPDGTDTPTTGWDLTLKDEDGVDLLCGDGANRDVADSGASEQMFTCPHNLAVASKLTYTVANGGDTKKGVVKVLLT
jgi:hypothetical protein